MKKRIKMNHNDSLLSLQYLLLIWPGDFRNFRENFASIKPKWKIAWKSWWGCYHRHLKRYAINKLYVTRNETYRCIVVVPPLEPWVWDKWEPSFCASNRRNIVDSMVWKWIESKQNFWSCNNIWIPWLQSKWVGQYNIYIWNIYMNPNHLFPIHLQFVWY